jgi:pyruvate formate lyase activating enzyme
MTEQQKVLVFKIDRLNTHNGPGYRTVIYFKGCPLHCTWCHNPEGISPRKEIWWHPAKCIGCGQCVETCPNHALSQTSRGIQVNREKCQGCYRCAEICPSGAIEKIGIEYSIDELIRIIKKDQLYFESSGGGVTVTGGEPGLHASFIAKLFGQCRASGISTALDTSGMFAISDFEKLLPQCDMLFLDIKHLNPEGSLTHTGMPVNKLQQVLECLCQHYQTSSSPKLEIRTPLIPGVTDGLDNLNEIANIINSLPVIPETWELCMFNDLCEDKYQKLGKNWIFNGAKHTQDDYRKLLDFKNEHWALPLKITGFIENKT